MLSMQTTIFKKMIEEDKSGTTQLILADAFFHLEISKEFDKLYQDETSWESNVSVFFLANLIKNLKEQKVKAEEKAALLEKTNVEQVQTLKQRLQEHIAILEERIYEYECSLCERNLALHAEMRTKTVADEKQEFVSIRHSHLANFKDAYLTFYHSKSAAEVPYAKIYEMYAAHHSFGMKNTAGDGLRKLICKEVIKRIKNDKVAVESNDILLDALSSKQDNYSNELIKTVNQQIDLKAKAFRKIYHALREGQSGIFKTNYLEGKEGLSSKDLINQVMEYSYLNPNSRTAKAWELTQKHYKNCSASNNVLFTSIYKWSFEKSGFLFKQSKIVSNTTFFSSTTFNENVKTLSSEQINIGKNKIGSRTEKIYKSL